MVQNIPYCYAVSCIVCHSSLCTILKVPVCARRTLWQSMLAYVCICTCRFSSKNRVIKWPCRTFTSTSHAVHLKRIMLAISCFRLFKIDYKSGLLIWRSLDWLFIGKHALIWANCSLSMWLIGFSFSSALCVISAFISISYAFKRVIKTRWFVSEWQTWCQ